MFSFQLIICLRCNFSPQTYFENNPHDLNLLRHDKALHTVRLQAHLKDVPEYIVPPTLRRLAGAGSKITRSAPSSSAEPEPSDKQKRNTKLSRKEKGFQKRKGNALFSFEFESFAKKSKK